MSEIVAVNGKAIKKKLIDLDMTGRDLAGEVGIHEQTITNMINGGPWSHQTINKIAAVLGCSPLELLTVRQEVKA